MQGLAIPATKRLQELLPRLSQPLCSFLPPSSPSLIHLNKYFIPSPFTVCIGICSSAAKPDPPAVPARALLALLSKNQTEFLWNMLCWFLDCSLHPSHPINLGELPPPGQSSQKPNSYLGCSPQLFLGSAANPKFLTLPERKKLREMRWAWPKGRFPAIPNILP